MVTPNPFGSRFEPADHGTKLSDANLIAPITADDESQRQAVPAQPPRPPAQSDPPPPPARTEPPAPPAQADPAVDAGLPPLPPVASTTNAPAEATVELANLLLGAGLSIAVAESLTGGGLAAELVRVPGISESFRGGIVAYQNEIKHSLLDVDSRVLYEHGAVHPEVARQMAAGVREKFVMDDRHADIGVSTTGVAGPGPAEDKPAGTVFIGVSSLWGEHVATLDFSNLVREDDPVGSRQRIRFATIEAAVFNVVEHLATYAET